jgi:hypothetical protein
MRLLSDAGLKRCADAWSTRMKLVGAILCLLSMPIAVNAQAIPGALPDSMAALSRGEWLAYAGTYAAAPVVLAFEQVASAIP